MKRGRNEKKTREEKTKITGQKRGGGMVPRILARRRRKSKRFWGGKGLDYNRTTGKGQVIKGVDHGGETNQAAGDTATPKAQ